jgi:hypothetical protein
MANEELQSILTLRDQMSAPLKHIHASLGTATKDMQKLQKETKQSTSFTKQFTQSMIPEIAAGDLLADTIKAIPGALADMVVWLVRTTSEVIKLVGAENDWSTKTRAMLQVMGSGASGNGQVLLGVVTDIAKQMGLKPEGLADAAQDLLGSGVRKEGRELQQSLQAIADLQATGSNVMANNLTNLIKRAAGARAGFKGQDTFAGMTSFSPTELEGALGKGGIQDFYKELSAIKGQPVHNWQEAMFKVRASSKDMIKALTQAAHTRVGPIAEKAWTLDRVRASWDATWKDMVSKVDFQPLYKALRGLIAVFDPLSKSGKSDSEMLTSAVQLMVKIATTAIKTLSLWILKLEIAFLKAFISVAPIVLKLAKWVKSHLEIIKVALISVAVVMGIVAVALAVTTFIAFLPLLILVGAIVVALIIFIAILTAVALAVMYVKKHLSEWGQAAKNASADLIDGLVSGIRKGIGGVKSAINDLSTGALKTMKDALGIHSPSTEFAKLGHFAGMGFAGGFDASMGGMNLALPAGKIAGGGGGPGEIHLGGIEVNITGVKDAEKIAPSLIPALTDAIEQILIEWGH